MVRCKRGRPCGANVVERFRTDAKAKRWSGDGGRSPILRSKWFGDLEFLAKGEGFYSGVEAVNLGAEPVVNGKRLLRVRAPWVL